MFGSLNTALVYSSSERLLREIAIQGWGQNMDSDREFTCQNFKKIAVICIFNFP